MTEVDIQPGQQAFITFSVFTPTGSAYDDLASYSSFGPTPDGRIKPDLVATGDTISATTSGGLSGSLNGCSTQQMQVWGMNKCGVWKRVQEG